MDALCETDVAEEVSEDILILLNINRPPVITYLNPLLHSSIMRQLLIYHPRVPVEVRNDHSDNVSLIAQLRVRLLVVQDLLGALFLLLGAGVRGATANSFAHSLLLLL